MMSRVRAEAGIETVGFGAEWTGSRAAFDSVASRYDELWTQTETGRLQRRAVWRHVDPLFRPGESILDFGCGTGEDALHYASAGIRVSAFDVSPGMVRVARERGVDANVLAFEDLARLSGTWDGALSNFGALNCVRDCEVVRDPLARVIRAGGYLAICVIGRFCLRESLHFLGRGPFRKAARRWKGASRSASLDLEVFYPTVRQIRRALSPVFSLVRTAGIGVCVPPSYIATGDLLPKWDAIDRRIAHLPIFRALSDHRLLIFVRS